MLVSTAMEQMAYKNITTMQKFKNLSIPLFNKVEAFHNIYIKEPHSIYASNMRMSIYSVSL